MRAWRQQPPVWSQCEQDQVLRDATSSEMLAPLHSTHLLQGLHRPLDLLLAVVELVLQLLRDLLEQLLREDAQQGPRDVQGREDVAVLVWPLGQELRLELVRELEVLVLVLAQRLLADDCLPM